MANHLPFLSTVPMPEEARPLSERAMISVIPLSNLSSFSLLCHVTKLLVRISVLGSKIRSSLYAERLEEQGH
ncbi:hypothetical protein LH53_05560 [Mesotoga sp. TolDC]|nr:hypothetical protein LH53_05560 [Mesotoga sp. TolDC]